MDKVTLHGVEYDLPCHVISLGLDLQCHHVMTPSILLSINEVEDKVIIESEGIKIRLHMKDLKDFYADTKEKRDRLETQCRKEYIEWKEAVRKQLETCSRRSI